MTVSEIEAKITNAPRLDFGKIFSDSIDLFKKSVVHGFVMQIIILAMALPLLVLIYIPMVMSVMAQQQQQQPIDAVNFEPVLDGFSIGAIVLFFIGILIIATLTIAIRCAFIRMLRALDEGAEVKTKDLFLFFKGKYLGKIFVLMLATVIISSVALFLFVLPFIYAIVPIFFFMYFFAFNPEMSVGDIVKLSFKIGTKKWLISFGLLFVSGVLASLLGFILCGIGGLFTAAFLYHPFYFIYKYVVGFDKSSSTVQNV